MALTDIVTVDISLQNGAVDRDGFGTPMVVGYHTHDTSSLVLTFDTASLSADLVTAGFSLTEPIAKAALAVAAQSPSASQFKIGRLTSQPTQRTKITPVVANASTYSFTVVSPSGVETDISYLSDGSALASEIMAGMIADLPAGLTGTDQTTYLRTVATTPGQQYSFKDFSSNLTFEEDTAVAGTLADQLAAIAAEDNEFYGFVLASKGTAEIAAASAWAESQSKVFAFATQNSDVVTSATTDIASVLQTATRMRTIAMYSLDIQEHADAAFLGKLLPYDPGSETWKFKTLAGISASTLSATQRGHLIAKNCNYYEAVKGRNITAEGKVSGGEWIDAIRLRDAVQSRVSEDIFGQFASQLKIKYDDGGIASIEAALRGALQFFVEGGGLLSFTTTFPKAAAVSSVDKANRTLTGSFTATLSGAIHFAAITGTLSV